MINLNITVTVADDSFLHIGGTPSPLTEKKAPVFKVNSQPVIPATSFKGALRWQLERLLIEKQEDLMKVFSCEKTYLEPCIPSVRKTKAEEHLPYRQESCTISVELSSVKISKNGDISCLCPACYLLGALGITGFVIIPNLFPVLSDSKNTIEQTNIRIDRKTGTAAQSAIVKGEQVKPGTQFKGTIEIAKSPYFKFGQARVIEDKTLDPWLTTEDKSTLIVEKLLKPSLKNITLLGGQRSRGAGKVKVEINEEG